MCVYVCVCLFFIEFLGFPWFRKVAIYTSILKVLNCLVVNHLSGSFAPVIFKFKYVHTHTHTHTHTDKHTQTHIHGLLWWLRNDKESTCNVGDPGSIAGLGRSPGEGNDNPLQYSCLEKPRDRGTWQAATDHGAAKSRTGPQRVGHDWMTEHNHDDVKT